MSKLIALALYMSSSLHEGDNEFSYSTLVYLYIVDVFPLTSPNSRLLPIIVLCGLHINRFP